MKVTLFIPCLVDQTAPQTARAIVTLLERLGHTTHYPLEQTCCGQALFNMGFRAEARDLAIRFIRIFAGAEVVVAPSGSCVAMVTKHYHELDLPAAEHKEWLSLKDRTWELTSFLVDKLKLTDVGASFPHTVTYHASCHHLRDLGLHYQPLALLRNVKGLTLVQGNWGDECCGFGGGFSVKYPELSHRIADRRATALLSGGAEFVTGADDSCLHNLGLAFRRANSTIKTIHIARILAGQE